MTLDLWIDILIALENESIGTLKYHVAKMFSYNDSTYSLE